MINLKIYFIVFAEIFKKSTFIGNKYPTKMNKKIILELFKSFSKKHCGKHIIL